ncbi:MAG: hypothetical protein Q9166_007980 [cf. Caloplaca sp. 2 TL-2023]
MSDFRERLQEVLAPDLSDPKLNRFERSLAVRYKKSQAYKAFYRSKNPNKCAAQILKIQTAVKKEAKGESAWQSYVLCKSYLLGAVFDARPKALENLDKVRRHLVMFNPGTGGIGTSYFEKAFPEMSDLRETFEKRLMQEKDPEFFKKTWWFHSTSSWPVRTTLTWLNQTAPKSDQTLSAAVSPLAAPNPESPPPILSSVVPPSHPTDDLPQLASTGKLPTTSIHPSPVPITLQIPSNRKRTVADIKAEEDNLNKEIEEFIARSYERKKQLREECKRAED